MTFIFKNQKESFGNMYIDVILCLKIENFTSPQSIYRSFQTPWSRESAFYYIDFLFYFITQRNEILAFLLVKW